MGEEEGQGGAHAEDAERSKMASHTSMESTITAEWESSRASVGFPRAASATVARRALAAASASARALYHAAKPAAAVGASPAPSMLRMDASGARLLETRGIREGRGGGGLYCTARAPVIRIPAPVGGESSKEARPLRRLQEHLAAVDGHDAVTR